MPEGRPIAPDSVPPLVEHCFRRSSGRLVAGLARTLGPDFLELAEDAVQDALVQALRLWPYRGVPRTPEAWLRRVARNRALDALRRSGRTVQNLEPEALDRALFRAERDRVGDDELAMILWCCDPMLSIDAQVALTLRTVGGLSTDEIAAAFLTSRETIQQRIVRAKRLLVSSGVPVELPAEADVGDRRESVLAVLYLMFSEGYAATEGEAPVRFELCGEATRLARIIAGREAVGGGEAAALLALFLFQASRLPSREGDDGSLVVLEDQDRTLWDRTLMAEGFHWLERATETPHLTRYHLEAGIAAGHAGASSWETTPWATILDLYDLLLELAPSPVVAVNRAVALGLARGAEEGLRALDGLEGSLSPSYSALPATRGFLLARAGRHGEASEAFSAALVGCRNPAMRRHLERRRDETARQALTGSEARRS